jgi:hypothetical protein
MLMVVAASAPTPLPPLTGEAPIPLGVLPFETTRYHLASYIIELILDRGVNRIRGI